MRMRCERFLNCFLILVLVAACSREKPVATQTTTTTRTPHPPAAATATTPAASTGHTYAGALDWYRSTKGFHYVVDDGTLHAEGDVTRERIGQEKVTMRTADGDFRAEPTTLGIQWQKLAGKQWKGTAPPPYGNRLYQRLTMAFDPQKKEGDAQVVASDAQTTLYRFTDANTGEVYDASVSSVDGHLQHLKVGSTFDLVITPK
jgi:hypothetical protein